MAEEIAQGFLWGLGLSVLWLVWLVAVALFHLKSSDDRSKKVACEAYWVWAASLALFWTVPIVAWIRADAVRYMGAVAVGLPGCLAAGVLMVLVGWHAQRGGYMALWCLPFTLFQRRPRAAASIARAWEKDAERHRRGAGLSRSESNILHVLVFLFFLGIGVVSEWLLWMMSS